jgi:hypothetical protein
MAQTHGRERLVTSGPHKPIAHRQVIILRTPRQQEMPEPILETSIIIMVASTTTTTNQPLLLALHTVQRRISC